MPEARSVEYVLTDRMIHQAVMLNPCREQKVSVHPRRFVSAIFSSQFSLVSLWGVELGARLRLALIPSERNWTFGAACVDPDDVREVGDAVGSGTSPTAVTHAPMGTLGSSLTVDEFTLTTPAMTLGANFETVGRARQDGGDQPVRTR